MVAQIIDGKAIAAQVREQVGQEVAEMIKEGVPQPGLATVLVGENPASRVCELKRSMRTGMQSLATSYRTAPRKVKPWSS
jgi:5,10-methylene-tetrahydrofolate dehydrogenase/methenyl tetrahydrofolate cyclohydrolase